MGVVVRVAAGDDVETLAALRRAWSDEQAGTTLDDPGFDSVFRDWFERERHHRVTWVAEADGRAVGMLNMLVFTRMPRPRGPAPARPSQWGYVANVYVEPDRRDGGVGRALLDAVVAHADDEGYARLVLAPSERSIPFYARAGFEPATSLMVRPGR